MSNDLFPHYPSCSHPLAHNNHYNNYWNNCKYYYWNSHAYKHNYGRHNRAKYI